jgi:putative acetyltransferase
MLITRETPELEDSVQAVLRAAFPTAAEAGLVDRLRRDGDMAIALAAREDHAAVGYAAFSRMAAPFKALGLGPVAVVPERQRQGIGSRLIRHGLQRAKAEGWEAVFVLGAPAYYSRFGFDANAAAGFASPYAGPHFMVVPLSAGGLAMRTGRVDYAPAFRDLA